MRNRPTPLFNSGPTRCGSAFDVDAEPGVRMVWLFVAMALPLLVVAGRLLHLQGFVAEGFAVETRRETQSVELIPARHGRILAADGTVLAFDEERYRVLVHYRWLEEPPNELWLRDAAVARLSRAERRDKIKVEQAKAAVLARREELWQSLAELTELRPDKLAELRGRVQQRVERIYRLVEERREAVEGSEQRHGDFLEPVPSTIQRAWQVVKQELTTPPTRERRDLLRISEQSDYHLLLDNVSLEAIAEIETHPEQYPGLRTDVTSQRIYPLGRIAPHLVGYRGEINTEELQSLRDRHPNGGPLDYQAGDTLGRTGIEQSYEHVLHGVRGQRKIVRDQHGTIVRTEVIKPPKPGRDVVLNFSIALQAEATKLLEEVVGDDLSRPPQADGSENSRPPGGCIVAIDVQTGAILAAATAPTFDVNELLADSAELRQAIESDPRRPQFSRSMQMTLPPGSVFKAVSAVAVMESHQLAAKHRIDPDREIECVGYLKDPNKFRCYHSHAHAGTDLTHALARSCNVYFFKAAQTLGPQPLVHWADEFGFGQLTGIDVPGEQRGHVPRPPEAAPKSRNGTRSPIELVSHERPIGDEADSLKPASPWEADGIAETASTTKARREPWYDGDTLGLAIGQSRLTVTPLQIARLMAAVANDGWLVTPQVAREISAAGEIDAMLSATIEPQRHRLSELSEGTLARVREGLEQVVAHPQGTGFKTVRMKEVKIAGKTGTAEIGGGRADHAWFAGYVPADRPRIAFVVVLEQAGSGGKVAGPIAKKFVQALLDQGLIQATK
ncbi:MAG: peptidoglycan D,D-transpeptidase FtsI family protein [Planctomycetaceae bacterium]